jgi:hypothetical protein
MPANDQANWQPIRQMPMIASMIDTSLDDTREHLATLTEAKARPHVLDDATIDRVEEVHTETNGFRCHLHSADQPVARRKAVSCPDTRVGSDGHAEPTAA